MVPYRWGQLTSTLLKAFLPNHQFKTYKVKSIHFQDIFTICMLDCRGKKDIGDAFIKYIDRFAFFKDHDLQGLMHSSSEEELQDMKKFIADSLP